MLSTSTYRRLVLERVIAKLANDKEKQVVGSFIEGLTSTIKYSEQSFTLYVDAVSGHDQNIGILKAPLKTIGEALKRVPREIHHSVTVKVAAGDYEGDFVVPFTVKPGGQFVLEGTWGDADIIGDLTGEVAATATRFITAVAPVEEWADHTLKGKFLSVLDGDYAGMIFPIVDNYESGGDFLIEIPFAASVLDPGVGFGLIEPASKITSGEVMIANKASMPADCVVKVLDLAGASLDLRSGALASVEHCSIDADIYAVTLYKSIAQMQYCSVSGSLFSAVMYGSELQPQACSFGDGSMGIVMRNGSIVYSATPLVIHDCDKGIELGNHCSVNLLGDRASASLVIRDCIKAISYDTAMGAQVSLLGTVITECGTAAAEAEGTIECPSITLIGHNDAIEIEHDGGATTFVFDVSGDPTDPGTVVDVSAVEGDFAECTITCVAQADMVDGETMTLVDFYGVEHTFEFNVTGVHVPAIGNLEVDISADGTDAEVAATLAGVIAGAGVFGSAVALAEVITVTQDAFGPEGNQTNSETVANAGFIVTDFAGGLDNTPSDVAAILAAAIDGEAEWTAVAVAELVTVTAAAAGTQGDGEITSSNVDFIVTDLTGGANQTATISMGEAAPNCYCSLTTSDCAFTANPDDNDFSFDDGANTFSYANLQAIAPMPATPEEPGNDTARDPVRLNTVRDA